MSEKVKKIARKLGVPHVLLTGEEGELDWKLYDEDGNLIATGIEAVKKAIGEYAVCRLKIDGKALCEIIEDSSRKEVEVDVD